MWSPVARPSGAPVVTDTVRPSAASLVSGLVWLWIVLVAWVGDQGTLAFRHWQELGWWTIAGCCVAAVTAVAVSTARRFPQRLDAVVAIATIVAGIIAFVVTAVYFYRSWIEGHGGYGLLGLWSSPAYWPGSPPVLRSIVAARPGARWRPGSVPRSSPKSLTQSRKPQWFGREPSPPPLFEPLLKLPALRAFELSPEKGPGFRYALAAGSCVVFVHESVSEDDRPRLDATLAQPWRAAFRSSQHTVTLRAVILLPGQRVPDIPADEALKSGAIPATERTFVDTVGPLLDDQDKVYVSIAERLLEKTAAVRR